MLDRLLPRQADNTYRGYKPALWLFALILVLKLAMSLNSIFIGHFVASSADGIPLDTYTPAGAQAVVSLFAIWGLAHLMICLLCILVLARYRALVPLMFALLLLEHVSRRVVLRFLPIATTGRASGSWVNLVLLALMVTGLALSLADRDRRRPQGAA